MAITASPPAGSKAFVDDDEDDYMSMTITEPAKPKEKETYTQRRIRKDREVSSTPVHFQFFYLTDLSR